ncbi:MAG: small subunit ribosomal protein [Archaeoglobi archaeon]|nr:30S ribosomal protein S17 [Candidatus Mnemosynella bozhongmuii]MDI3502983.1 small subunit ribosomal protein [Archaeoglobi archaeon]MDK2781012.1 small subunit ribosomal protein [Archaeoglobi archaeon]
MARDIGIDVKPPEGECDDENCPFHGKLSVRGQIFVGKVVSDRAQKTVVVERELLRKVPKYERYLKKRSKLHAHNPPCINARVGDVVKIAECRPLSKTKHFVVVEILERGEA